MAKFFWRSSERSFPKKKSPLPWRLLKWAVVLLLIYTIAGFFILPPIIRSVAVKQLSKQLHREVAIEKVKLNPFACSATIHGVLIKEKDGSPFVSWEEVYAKVKLTSLLRSTWVVSEVRVTKPFAHVQMNGDGSFNFSDILLALSGTNAPAPAPKKAAKPLAVRLDRLQVSDAVLSLKREASTVTNAVPPPVETAAASFTNKPDPILLLLQSVTNVFGQLQLSTNAGKATLADIDLTNCAVQLEDLANARPVNLTIDQIRVLAKNVSNLGETNLTADVSLRWNTNGSIKTEISAMIRPAAADVHLVLNDLELRPLDPYLASKLNVFILGSKLGMDGRVRLRGTNDALPEVSFTGNTWLNDFHSVDSVLAEDLIKWNTIRISGINANLNPASVAVDEFLIKDFYARLIIETNKTINVLAAMKLTETNVVVEAQAPPAKDTPPAPKKSLLAGDTLIDTNILAQLPLKKFSLGRLVITNAHANYSDRSISPNVNMSVEQINGSIAGISSDELQRMTIDFHASVDNVGPVDVTGAIAPFRGNETNEIKVLVKDVDLTPTSPYSGKFAGYRIAKGKLNVALEYHLRGRQLKSQNVITLDQFTFGEKVNSPDAVHLPVKLAIAVLKDRDGKIILDVPIEGSLDDPQLKLSKVIWHTLGTIIVKAATSPFAVLGAVFGGKGEEISYQDFPPGSAELVPASREKLDVMVKGLYERPGLQLEISGSVDPDADRDGLRAVNLEKQLRMAKWLKLRKADQESTTADQIVVSPEERPDLVKKLYAEALAKGLIVPSTKSTNAATAPVRTPSLFVPVKAERGATELIKKEPSPAVLVQTPTTATNTNAPAVENPFEAALLSSMPVSDSDYQALATARAKTVREYILQTGKVETQRLFLTEYQPGNVKTNGSRVYLQLQ